MPGRTFTSGRLYRRTFPIGRLYRRTFLTGRLYKKTLIGKLFRKAEGRHR
jgi:hypothetical protein